MILDQITFTIKKPSENIRRSLLKTISWRIVGTADTVIISYALTRKFEIAFSIGAVELVTKMVLYFFHERIWSRINLRN